ncbi:MAG: Spy/CpxP family protein refolding chaperone [Gammaproteobacteria bacterium]|nr:Spy/CpxP family protein refolding chaperone [Gammaproteobacteria bacterium]
MRYSVVLQAALLASAVATSPVYAGDKSGHPHDDMGGWQDSSGHHGGKEWGGEHGWKGDWSVEDRLAKMKTHLKLSDQQVAQIKDIFERSDLQLKPLQEQSKSNREQIRAMVDSGSINDAELERLAKAQGDLKAQKIIIRSKSRVDVMNVLNADQLAQFKEYWNKRGHHGKGWSE